MKRPRQTTIDFPEWVTLTPCKTQTHRIVKLTSRGAVGTNFTITIGTPWPRG